MSKTEMKFDVCASGLVCEFERRGINPDETTQVIQGTLRLWMYCNSYVAKLELPGGTCLTGGAYINIHTPQEIADDLSVLLAGAVLPVTP